ncbi:MAG: hypothetical protein IKD68_00670, partial [Solobacterium sp.]|nr:hypothetical protein [Solobacterium sp.]
FKDMNALYRLNETGAVNTSKEDLGPLPTASKALLISLALIWAMIIAWYFYDQNKRRKAASKQ